MTTLILADVLFVLFLTYGYAFPSKMTLPEPQKTLTAAEYDYSAKVSPFVAPQRAGKQRLTPPLQ